MDRTTLEAHFIQPPAEYRPRPLWMWNGTPDTCTIQEIMEKSTELSGYGGFHIIPFENCDLEYMSESYLDVYGEVLKQAKQLGVKLCLYDEWGFPSGTAAGQMQKKFPQYCTKRLDKIETDVLGPVLFQQPVNIFEAKSEPSGNIMAAVGMEKESLQRVDLSGYINQGYLTWDVPEGEWKIMVFICVLDGWDRVDYLNPEAVAEFIGLTHERYYQKFPEYFPQVVDSAFYDEPNLYKAQGRTWTENFNEKFEAVTGYSPELLYPALWHNIGPDTAAARNALLGFRAELYATGFPKIIDEWCTSRGLQLTGHVDQEEVINPVGITGDLMKSFKYQAIPGIDEIFFPRRARKVYKIVSSSAFNWGKKLVMSETYGAMGEVVTKAQLIKEILEQFVKGVNYFVPHGIWLDNKPEKILFPPELSYRSEKYGALLWEINTLTARLSTVLQQGYAVSDIGILYPIHSLQSSYRFDSYEPYTGGPVTAYDDYQDVGETVFSEFQKDFQFLHPEFLDEFCWVEKGALCFDNGKHRGEFKLVILPGMSTVSLKNLQLLQKFLEQGGSLIATSQLPYQASDFGQNESVLHLIQSMFGVESPEVQNAPIQKNHENGGIAYFIPAGGKRLFADVVASVLKLPDVEFLGETSKNLTYVHKQIEGKQLYFIVNNQEYPVTVQVNLRGLMKLEYWDPHTGAIRVPEQHQVDTERTGVKLSLEPISSGFLFEK